MTSTTKSTTSLTETTAPSAPRVEGWLTIAVDTSLQVEDVASIAGTIRKAISQEVAVPEDNVSVTYSLSGRRLLSGAVHWIFHYIVTVPLPAASGPGSTPSIISVDSVKNSISQLLSLPTVPCSVANAFPATLSVSLLSFTQPEAVQAATAAAPTLYQFHQSLCETSTTSAGSTSNSAGSKNMLGLEAGGAAAGVLVLTVAVLFWLIWRARKRRGFMRITLPNGEQKEVEWIKKKAGGPEWRPALQREPSISRIWSFHLYKVPAKCEIHLELDKETLAVFGCIRGQKEGEAWDLEEGGRDLAEAGDKSAMPAPVHVGRAPCLGLVSRKAAWPFQCHEWVEYFSSTTGHWTHGEILGIEDTSDCLLYQVVAGPRRRLRRCIGLDHLRQAFEPGEPVSFLQSGKWVPAFVTSKCPISLAFRHYDIQLEDQALASVGAELLRRRWLPGARVWVLTDKKQGWCQGAVLLEEEGAALEWPMVTVNLSEGARPLRKTQVPGYYLSPLAFPNAPPSFPLARPHHLHPALLAGDLGSEDSEELDPSRAGT